MIIIMLVFYLSKWEHSESQNYTVLTGSETPFSVPTSNEAAPSETHSIQSAHQSSIQPTSYISNSKKRKAYSIT